MMWKGFWSENSYISQTLTCFSPTIIEVLLDDKKNHEKDSRDWGYGPNRV